MRKETAELESSWLKSAEAVIDGNEVTRLVLIKDSGKQLVYLGTDGKTIPLSLFEELKNSDHAGTLYREKIQDQYEALYQGQELVG